MMTDQEFDLLIAVEDAIETMMDTESASRQTYVNCHAVPYQEGAGRAWDRAVEYVNRYLTPRKALNQVRREIRAAEVQ